MFSCLETDVNTNCFFFFFSKSRDSCVASVAIVYRSYVPLYITKSLFVGIIVGTRDYRLFSRYIFQDNIKKKKK